MARLSLLLAFVAPVSCVVSDPAEYGVAKQTPPFLDANKASPSVLLTRPLASGEKLLVNVPVRSEDAGEELRAVLFLDRNLAKQQLLDVREVPPGKLEDTGRSISASAVIPDVVGCHSVCLVVTHKSNLNEDTKEPIRSDDAAVLTWWVNVDDDGTNLLGDCPVGGN